MKDLALVSIPVVLGLATALIARRKGRSTFWWFLGGAIGGIAALVLICVEPPAGQDGRFRGPLAVLILAVALVGFFVLLAVVAELVG